MNCYLAVENIDHTRTKVKSPQTNGIVERFHKTVLNEFYRVAFRRKIYSGIEQLQADLDAWLREYNELRPHQGRWCYGKTPLQTFRDSVPLAKEKMLGPDYRRRGGRESGIMNGCVAQQSPWRLPNRLPRRSDGCGQGRREPARIARAPLTASRRAGYRCARHLTYYSNRTPGPTHRLSEEVLSYTAISTSKRASPCRTPSSNPIWIPPVCKRNSVDLNGTRLQSCIRPV